MQWAKRATRGLGLSGGLPFGRARIDGDEAIFWKAGSVRFGGGQIDRSGTCLRAVSWAAAAGTEADPFGSDRIMGGA